MIAIEVRLSYRVSNCKKYLFLKEKSLKVLRNYENFYYTIVKLRTVLPYRVFKYKKRASAEYSNFGVGNIGSSDLWSTKSVKVTF